jgi:hypothetical protein
MGIETKVVGNVRTASVVSMPPQLGGLLTELAEVPDIRMALRKVLSEYLEFKLNLEALTSAANVR